MKLIDFRITNYKTIEDSGVITCHDVTAFVGKNEAGKTSLLRALSKLKPTDKQEFDPLREFPRKRFTDEFKKKRWEVVSATFGFTPVETAELAKISPLLKAVTKATVTRYYDGKYSVGFDPEANANPVTQAAWTAALRDAIAPLDGILPKMGDAWTPEQQQQAKNNWASAQQAIRNHLNTEIKNANAPDLARVNKMKDIIVQHTGDDWSRNHLERARAVYETKGGTKVSDDVWPKDNDSLFPLQAALGYSICQSLFVAKKQVVVEGITDYMLLTALNCALPVEKKLRSDVILLPIGGATNFTPFAALLASHGVKFVALPDSDAEGNRAKGKLEKLRKMIGEDKGRITSYDALTEDAKVQELEDMIPEAHYLAAVQSLYPNTNLAFSSDEIGKTPSIVDRCKERVKASGGIFDKLLPIQAIVAEINAKGAAVPAALYKNAETVFANLGKLF